LALNYVHDCVLNRKRLRKILGYFRKILDYFRKILDYFRKILDLLSRVRVSHYGHRANA